LTGRSVAYSGPRLVAFVWRDRIEANANWGVESVLAIRFSLHGMTGGQRSSNAADWSN
jgi:hypothetical protein